MIFRCLPFDLQSSRLNQQGFMVSTQVPSLKDASVRHEGVILSLANDMYVTNHFAAIYRISSYEV